MPLVGHLPFFPAEKQKLEELVYKQWPLIYMVFQKLYPHWYNMGNSKPGFSYYKRQESDLATQLLLQNTCVISYNNCSSLHTSSNRSPGLLNYLQRFQLSWSSVATNGAKLDGWNFHFHQLWPPLIWKRLLYSKKALLLISWSMFQI